MTIGMMNKPAQICTLTTTVDSEGFSSQTQTVVANIRVYIENKNASERWANLSSISEVTDLFRFRKIPNITLTPSHFIVYNNIRYNILSVENIKGRGMYLEVLAKRVDTSNG